MFGCQFTTLLCSIFLPVLVKAIPCIGKDLGMSTVTYAGSMSWSFGSSRASRSRALARMSVALAPGLGRHGASLCDACDIPTHAADGYA